MKCMSCGKEMKNTLGGNYSCDCGFAINDLVYRPPTNGIIPDPLFISHGWICPKCGAVMSPTTSVCINCYGSKGNLIGIAPSIDIDWTKHQTQTISTGTNSTTIGERQLCGSAKKTKE